MSETAAFPIGLSVAEARARMVGIASRQAQPAESIALENALGRVLAHDVHAPFDVPGFANSAMDGYALRFADLQREHETPLRLGGVVLAGGAGAPQVETGHCVRITTGAPLPPGADTVVMKENTRAEGDVVHIAPGTPRGAHVRPAGEDYRSGDLALARGTMLAPADLGALASFGYDHAQVARRPRAVLLTTGDELVTPGRPLGFGQIHDSNRYSLGALLEQHGALLVRHERVRDDPVALRDALVRAGADADIVLSSGGVSAGEADYLPRVLGEIGTLHFWKVRIKPGMPFLCGSIGDALVCALPGNAVSGIAIFLTLVKPALDAMLGRADATLKLRARLTQAIHKRHARAEFVRATLHCDDTAVLHATPHGKQGSGMLRGLAEANALIVIPEGPQDFSAGALVDVLPLPGWI